MVFLGWIATYGWVKNPTLQKTRQIFLQAHYYQDFREDDQ